MSIKTVNVAFLAGTLFILTSALCYASLGNASTETSTTVSPVGAFKKQQTMPSALTTPLPSSSKEPSSSKVSPIQPQPENFAYCVVTNNADGLVEQRTCYFENGTSLVEDIDYVAKFEGPQSVINELQKTTSDPLGRYSSIFENGDSYCINRDFTFSCFNPVTNSLFTQTWYRADDGQKVFTDPIPYSSSESN